MLDEVKADLYLYPANIGPYGKGGAVRIESDLGQALVDDLDPSDLSVGEKIEAALIHASMDAYAHEVFAHLIEEGGLTEDAVLEAIEAAISK